MSGFDYLSIARAAAKRCGVDLDAVMSAPEPECMLKAARITTRPGPRYLVAEAPSGKSCLRCSGGLYEPAGELSASRGVPYHPCPGDALRRLARRLNEAAIPAAFTEATIANTYSPQFAQAVRRPDWTPGSPGWWLWGRTGRGKSWALAVAAKHAIAKGVHTRWVNLPELVTRLKATWSQRDANEDQILEPLKRVPLLVLDEIGGTVLDRRGNRSLDNHEVAYLAAIIDARSAGEGLTTWVTSNLQPEELAALGDQQLERTWSRLTDVRRMHRPLQIEGPDRRQQ